jgi:hypothetical protein
LLANWQILHTGMRGLDMVEVRSCQKLGPTMSDGEWVTLPMGRARREESGIVYVLIESHTPAPGDDQVQAAVDVIDMMKAKLIPEGRAPVLIDAEGLEWIDRESRQVITQSNHASARAIIARTAPAKATAGALATVDRPNVPTKVFSNEAAARAWLQQFL